MDFLQCAGTIGFMNEETTNQQSPYTPCCNEVHKPITFSCEWQAKGVHLIGPCEILPENVKLNCRK